MKKAVRDFLKDMITGLLEGHPIEPHWIEEDPSIRLDPQFVRTVNAEFWKAKTHILADMGDRYADDLLAMERDRGPISDERHKRIVRSAREAVHDRPVWETYRMLLWIKSEKRKAKQRGQKDGRLGPEDVTYGKMEAAANKAAAQDRIEACEVEAHGDRAKTEGLSTPADAETTASSRTHVVFAEAGLERLAGTGRTANERQQIEFKLRLAKPKLLGGPEDVHGIDELFAEAYALSRWNRDFLSWSYRLVRDAYAVGRNYFWLPPVLFVGLPGVGKTHLAHILGSLTKLPVERIDLGARGAPFDITGMEFGWSTAYPGLPAKTIAETETANPIMILDEVEKSGAGGNAGSPADALLPLLQVDTASRFLCPYLRSRVDLSKITYIATANDLSRISAPMRDRFTIFHVDAPSGADLLWHVNERLGRFSDGVHVAPVCDAVERNKMSLRSIDRLKAEFEAIERKPWLH